MLDDENRIHLDNIWLWTRRMQGSAKACAADSIGGVGPISRARQACLVALQDARRSAEVQDRALDSATYTAALAAVAAQRAAAAAAQTRCGECEACDDVARARPRPPL